VIVELYRDAGTIDKDGEKVPYVNHAHEWWVRFDNGATRPASESEVELWQELERHKADHQSACELAWGLYSAAMGITVAPFDGLLGPDPITVVKAERKRLLDHEYKGSDSE
jgi:hypothetical protein